MLRIFAVLLAISIINVNAMLLDTSVIGIRKLLEWPVEIMQIANQYRNQGTTREHTVKMLQKVNESASKLRTADEHLNLKCDRNFALLIGEILADGFDFENAGAKLCNRIEKVDRFFDESEKYEYGKTISNESVNDFGQEVLWGDISLSDSLNDIRDSIMASMFYSTSSLHMRQNSKHNIEHDCDTQASAQQLIYNFYLQLILAEMKGLVTVQRIYLSKRLMNGSAHKYIAELELATQTLKTRLSEYHDIISQGIKNLPQRIRRCNVKQPKLGNNIIELLKFSRFTILDPKNVDRNRCDRCPSQSQLQEIGLLSNTTINDCTSLGVTVKSCPPKPGSNRDHLWWQDKQGTYYGHNTSCDATKLIEGELKELYLGRLVKCTLCACSVDQNRTEEFDNSTIWRISVTDQMSDISNNMVVTGVRFITYGNALHLQIRQANFSHGGQPFNNDSWKELDLGFGDGGLTQTKREMSYVPLRHDRKTLYLDDITVPEGHVITGIGFQSVGDSAFKLRVFASQYDFGTSKVFPFGSYWYSAPMNARRSEDYKRNRVEINLDQSDDPTRSVQFEYDPESNKQVKFTHTDIHKDAGQTTIPLIDAQPVITQPPFPLSGIGLSFSGKKGFGGYIVPRIYTVGVSDYMKSLQKSLNINNSTIEGSSRIGEELNFILRRSQDMESLAQSRYTVDE